VWSGSKAAIEWSRPAAAKPDAEATAWVADAAKKAKSMLYTDRIYCANLYDAMAHVIEMDGKREKAIIGDTGRFAAFHAGSLDFAIDTKNVGKYPGLGEAIDNAFERALGLDVKPLDAAARARAEKACRALSYAFSVGGNE
jgi:cytolysin (calcineurin-like family phosphatase)